LDGHGLPRFSMPVARASSPPLARRSGLPDLRIK
jgi:hypothetical protein